MAIVEDATVQSTRLLATPCAVRAGTLTSTERHSRRTLALAMRAVLMVCSVMA